MLSSVCANVNILRKDGTLYRIHFSIRRYCHINCLTLLAGTFTLLAVAGKCPKGKKNSRGRSTWTSFQSRCYYHQDPDKKSLSDAGSTCAAAGGSLSRHFSTHVQKDFLILHAFPRALDLRPVFTGITDPGFSHILDGETYRVKLCGNNASLLYKDHRDSPKLDCSAPNLYTCEVNKGKSYYSIS